MPYQLEIEGLAHGGPGVGRRDGRAVFVDGGAPGDLALVEPTREGTRPERARLLSVIRPGVARVAPRCPHFGDCGGCQWQHVSTEGQRLAKRQALEDALVRIARIPRERLPEVRAEAGLGWAYRRRARLAVAPDGRLGFSARASRRVVAIKGCALLEPELEARALALSRELAVRPIPGLAHLELVTAGGKAAAWLQLEVGAAPGPARERAAAWLGGEQRLAGVVVGSGRERRVLGDPVLRDGERLLAPDVFAQASREGNERLVAAALAALAPGPSDRALELYAGTGNFTLELARQAASVLAVEGEPAALALARRALPAPLAPRVSFAAGEVGEILRALDRRGERFDVALLDPPRAGAKEAVGALAALVGRRIAYVSCDPATLARDVGTLAHAGFRVTSALALDLFPQTYHLESVVALERVA